MNNTFKDVSAMDMFIEFRKSIQTMIKENPDATAEDVLKGLELTVDILNLFIKRIGKGESNEPKL